jgi:hypothetical protein
VYLLFFRSLESPNLTVAEQRSSSRGKEESLVRKWVLETANDPSSVEFDRWGPHDLNVKYGTAYLLGGVPVVLADNQEARAVAFAGDGKQPSKIIRVRFREKNTKGAKQMKDWLIEIQGEKIVHVETNIAGDDWRIPLLKARDLPQ